MGNWKNQETLRKLYWDEGLTTAEVGKKLGCSRQTIHKWMNRHGIERRGKAGSDPNAPYKDKDKLQKLYHEEKLNCFEIADKFDTTDSTIRDWMDRFDIERIPMGPKTPEPNLYTTGEGYEFISHQQGDEFRLHRLLAVAEYGFEKVKGREVHHKNNIPWDNRPENLELLSKEDHARHHAIESGLGKNHG